MYAINTINIYYISSRKGRFCVIPSAAILRTFHSYFRVAKTN